MNAITLNARIDRAIAEIGPRLDDLEKRVLELESKQREPIWKVKP